MLATFPAFLAFTALLVLTPGSTTAVVVSHTLAGGRAAGIRAALGAALGNLTQSLVAGAGVGALLVGAPVARRSVQMAGAGYLAYLGLRHFVAAWRGWRAHGVAAGTFEAALQPDTGALRDGLLTNLLNPAITTFYLVAVPTFLPTRTLRLGQDAPTYVFYTAIHVGLALLCHCGWASGLARLRSAWSGMTARVVLSGLSGLALLLLAVRILR